MGKRTVIVDIDGTISIPGGRLKYLQQEPKDWDSFYADCFDDKPIPEMVDLVTRLYYNYRVVFCTGRRERCREKTVNWLKNNSSVLDLCPLLMRKDGDLRPDAIIKPELIAEAGIDLNDIAFVIEDRKSMVDKYREMGLLVLQCAEGNF